VKANLTVETDYDCSGNGLDLRIANRGKSSAKVHVYDAYKRQTTVQSIGEGDEWKRHFALAGSFGWYDLTVQVEGHGSFVHRVAGHVETGERPGARGVVTTSTARLPRRSTRAGGASRSLSVGAGLPRSIPGTLSPVSGLLHASLTLV
jgi:hypothetical protein